MRSSMENTRDQDIGKEYTIARLSNDNLAHLEQLYEAVYGRKMRPGFYKEKYDTAYTGITCIGYIAYSLQYEPVAYYGVIPCFIEYAGRNILAAQSADTMTHPGHRYKGMFAELSRLTFALCREAGLRLIFGFPNQQSYPGAIRMGWKETERMSLFDVRVFTLPLASLSLRWPFIKAWYGRYQRSIIARYALPLAGVRNTVLTGDAAGVQRSGAYLAYKKYNVTQVLQIGQAKIWVKLGPILFIGDMEQVDENNFDSVMDTLKGICRRLGIRQLAFHISPDTALHRLWSARYEAIPSYPVLFQDFDAALPLEKIKFTFADIDIF
jgi:hypothetical protein